MRIKVFPSESFSVFKVVIKMLECRVNREVTWFHDVWTNLGHDVEFSMRLDQLFLLLQFSAYEGSNLTQTVSISLNKFTSKLVPCSFTLWIEIASLNSLVMPIDLLFHENSCS